MVVAADRFETLAWVYSQPELAVILSALEQEGIRVIAVGQGHAAVQWNWTIALGGVELRVPAVEAERARARFADFEPMPCRGGLFGGVPLVEIVILFFLCLLVGFAAPARIATEFVRPAPAGPRLED